MQLSHTREKSSSQQVIQNKKEKNIKTQIEIEKKRHPTPTPFKLAQGKQLFYVSNGRGSPGPNIRQLIIDPLDAKKGQKQIWEIKVKKDIPATAIYITIKTDNKSHRRQLELIKNNDPIYQTWQTSIIEDDSHDHVYRATIEGISKSGKAVINPHFR